MKSKKLNLKELKVKSFVTNLEKDNMKTAKGGEATHYHPGVSTCCWGQNTNLFQEC